MISDTERREVARKLREDAANDKLREQVFVEEIIAGCIGETMYDEWGNVREVEILTRLADLIDVPTTALRAELDCWKAQPDASYMKLPVDADGVPIRIGDEMDIGGEIAIVKGYQISYEGSELLFIAVSEDDRRTFTFFGKNRKHFKHDTMPVDSWEKLEEDLNLGCCDYCGKYRLEECDYNMRVHMHARAKKLAGIEDGAQR